MKLRKTVTARGDDLFVQLPTKAFDVDAGDVLLIDEKKDELNIKILRKKKEAGSE